MNVQTIKKKTIVALDDGGQIFLSQFKLQALAFKGRQSENFSLRIFLAHFFFYSFKSKQTNLRNTRKKTD